MQLGAVLSQGEVATDVGALRAYVQAVRDLGYDFLVVADHVVGSDPKAHPELERVYPIEAYLHEAMTLLGFIAGVAPRLGLLTSVIILPQRQTVLAAKQATEIDILTGGRFRFGIGIGWNPVEFEALGMEFRTRARRFEEQIALMRRLWTEQLVTFAGRFDRTSAAGFNPLPVQRPIPVWLGAHSDVAVERATRIADGYLPLRPLEGGWNATMERIDGWLAEAGRDRSTFGIEGRVEAGKGTPDEWAATAEMWRGFGASHLSVSTGGAGGPDEQIARLREVQALARG
ncbi:MAG: LLM class F420-dependent oxidoreductase [Chloroflexota bacterium]|nr:MAG: LLM class F420-dependent oxidoreductase [Chloroflexota bacterium]